MDNFIKGHSRTLLLSTLLFYFVLDTIATGLKLETLAYILEVLGSITVISLLSIIVVTLVKWCIYLDKKDREKDGDLFDEVRKSKH